MAGAPKQALEKLKPERKLAPGPERKLLGDQLVPMSRDPLGFLLKTARDYPDIATFKLGPQRTFLLTKPDYVESVLVANDWNFVKGRGLQRAKKVLGKGLLTSEGNFHRRQRRLSQPAFHRQRIAAYAGIMADYAARTRDRWKPGETRDIAHEMMQLTLAIVAKTLFDADVEGEAQEIGEALT
ncbi:MAG: cytochrome P450, partial [Blastocatellia bacterium]